MRRSPLLALVFILGIWITAMGASCPDSTVTPEPELDPRGQFTISPADVRPGGEFVIDFTGDASESSVTTRGFIYIYRDRTEPPATDIHDQDGVVFSDGASASGTHVEGQSRATLPAGKYLVAMWVQAEGYDPIPGTGEMAGEWVYRELIVSDCGDAPILDEIPISHFAASSANNLNQIADVVLDLPDAAWGEPYQHDFAGRFSGGVAPLTFTPDYELDRLPFPILTDGILEGTPSEAFIPRSGGVITTDLVVTDSCTPPRNYYIRTKINVQPDPTFCFPVEFSPALFPEAPLGELYSHTIGMTSGRPPFTYTITEGNLPTGLSIVGNVITGTPAFVGTEHFTLRATDSCDPPQSVTRNFAIRVTGEAVCPNNLDFLTTDPLPSGFVGIPYNVTFHGFGGTPPYTFEEGSVVLPAGLTYANGVISGTPTATGTGLVRIFIRDSCVPPKSVEKSFNLVITPAGCTPLDFPNGLMSQGTVGTPYADTVLASGGALPLSFAVVSGNLPNGLSMATNGVISGTPTTEETANFTVRVTDSCATPQTKDSVKTIHIEPAGSCPAFAITTPNALPDGTTHVFYDFQIAVAGGVFPYAFQITEGTLPPGLTMSSDGVISGTTVVDGPEEFFTVEVSDACVPPQVVSKQFGLRVNIYICDLLSFVTHTLPNGTLDAPYSQQLETTDGEGTITFGFTTGSLPPGLELSTDGILAGTPEVLGTFNFRATATDECPVGSSIAEWDFSVTIVPPSVCDELFAEAFEPDDGTVSQPYSFTFLGVGGFGVIRTRLESGTLPPGLSLDGNTNLLSGTPTTAGSYSFEVTFFDECSPSQELTKAVTIDVL